MTEGGCRRRSALREGKPECEIKKGGYRRIYRRKTRGGETLLWKTELKPSSATVLDSSHDPVRNRTG